MLCDIADGSSVVELIVLILRLDRGVVMPTSMILLLLVPFSTSLEIARFVGPF